MAECWNYQYDYIYNVILSDDWFCEIMTEITYYAELRNLILQMERDMSIVSLTEIEKKVISALIILSNKEQKPIHLDQLREHPLVKSMPQPSLYRAFQTLIKSGYIDKVGTERSGLYVPQIKKFSWFTPDDHVINVFWYIIKFDIPIIGVL